MHMAAQFIAVLIILITRGIAKRYLILGETGDGKSTTIKEVFDAIEYVPIGTKMTSETKNVDVYHSSNTSIFKGSEIHDTPGFEDTDGLTNDQILQLIEVSFAELDRNESVIDGMILIIGTNRNRDRSSLHITHYLELFGEDMLQNFMVIVNRFEYALKDEKAMEKYYESKAHLKVSLQQIVDNSKKYSNTSLEIPLVAIDCREPSSEQLNMVYNKLLSLKPYKLKNMNQEKYARIQQIFDDIIANKENYKDIIENIIVHKNITVTKEALQRTTVPKEKKVYVGQSWGVNLGFLKVGGSPQYATEIENVPVDIIVPLQEQQTIPTNEQNVTQVLKNEELVYWEIAKKQYKEELRQQFTANK